MLPVLGPGTSPDEPGAYCRVGVKSVPILSDALGGCPTSSTLTLKGKLEGGTEKKRRGHRATVSHEGQPQSQVALWESPDHPTTGHVGTRATSCSSSCGVPTSHTSTCFREGQALSLHTLHFCPINQSPRGAVRGPMKTRNLSQWAPQIHGRKTPYTPTHIHTHKCGAGGSRAERTPGVAPKLAT